MSARFCRAPGEIHRSNTTTKNRKKPEKNPKGHIFSKRRVVFPAPAKKGAFLGFFAFSVPSHSMQTLQQHPRHRFGVIPAQAGDAIWAQLRLPPWPSEGLWEYPAPWGGRDAPSCTNPATSPQPRAAFNQPSGASIPMQLGAKHHLETTIPPWQAAGASQSCFAQRWDTTECPHPVLADP